MPPPDEDASLLATDRDGDGSRTTRTGPAGDSVELIVLTTDEALLGVVEEATGPARKLWHVGSADEVADLLLSGQVGVVILDVAALREPCTEFVPQLKRQFPDLIVMVAGSRESEIALSSLISTGAVYRFIHKPLSPGRARLFTDAAIRKYEEQRKLVAAATDTRSFAVEGHRGWLIAGAGCMIVALIAAAWIGIARHHRRDDGRASITGLISTEARTASAPPTAPASPESAVPSGSRASSGSLASSGPREPAGAPLPSDPRERALAQAERALADDRLNDAAAALDAARRAGTKSPRLIVLIAQLAKAREQHKVSAAERRGFDAIGAASARSTTAAGTCNPGNTPASATANSAGTAGPASTASLTDATGTAGSGNTASPGNTAALDGASAQRAATMLAQARAAIDAKDFSTAVTVLDAADGIARPADIDAVLQQLRAARRADAQTREQPATAATASVGDGAPTARRSAEHPAAENPGAENPVAERPEQRTASSTAGNDVPFVSASTLKLVKSVQPRYPRQATLAKTEGWVELAFTVTSAGTVADIVVTAAEPADVFDAAAVAALAQWRYQPIIRDGRPVDERARMRMRFKLTL